MPIGNLGNKISQSELERMKDIQHPPEFEPGFDGGGSSDGSDFDFGFDSLDGFGSDSGGSDSLSDIFGSSSSSNDSDLFGGNQGSSFGGGLSNNGGFGNNTGFGGDGLFQNPLTQNQQQQQQVQPQEDLFDKTFDASVEVAQNLGILLIDMVKSVKNRTADDFGYLSRNLVLVGGASGVVALVIGILGSLQGIKLISFSGLPIHVILAGLCTIGPGLIGFGLSAYRIMQTGGNSSATTLQDVPDISSQAEDDATDDYENSIGDIMDDLFGDDLDAFSFDEEKPTDSTEPEEDSNAFDDTTPVFASPAPITDINYDNVVDNVRANQYINRESLFNTFKPFFPTNTPGFADKVELDKESDKFLQLSYLSLKALSNVAKCELEDLKSSLESAVETFFSYELKLKRIRGLNKVDEIAREIETYLRSSIKDNTVNATVDIDGDFYNIVVTKGESAIVTMGDIFTQSYVEQFICDEKNKLPMITGITELGEVIMHDAKLFDTMLIAGKPRSGKSWYVLSILLMLALFNTPEDVQFIIIDPKESNLFNTLALLPHVAGLHNDTHTLDIMDDLINNEAPRRKKLLADNKCDDIWALRKKGIKLPVLYLVIDEYITVRSNLGTAAKDLDSKLQVIISQLPSQGIRLLFVPHRATGIVDKTNRTMLQFTAAVRANTEDVKDTLGILKWTRGLTEPGDIAVKTSMSQDAFYVRGTAVTTDDDKNTELIRSAAKAFYKMGVDMPDMSTMSIAVNRDEAKIRAELQGDTRRLQYDNWDDTD